MKRKGCRDANLINEQFQKPCVAAFRLGVERNADRLHEQFAQQGETLMTLLSCGKVVTFAASMYAVRISTSPAIVTVCRRPVVIQSARLGGTIKTRVGVHHHNALCSVEKLAFGVGMPTRGHTDRPPALHDDDRPGQAVVLLVFMGWMRCHGRNSTGIGR
jgi:hypothetical protein